MGTAPLILEFSVFACELGVTRQVLVDVQPRKTAFRPDMAVGGVVGGAIERSEGDVDVAWRVVAPERELGAAIGAEAPLGMGR